MKTTSTTLELPEGSKATIQGKVIDGKNYLVVEVEQEPEKSDTPEWTKFKRGDVLKGNSGVMVLFDKFYYEYSMERHELEIAFRSLINNKGTGNNHWNVDAFILATDKEKAELFNWLREEKGLEWDGEKLVKTKSNIPKAGDLCIIFNRDYSHAFIAKYVWFLDSCYDNIIKWDGTKEQFEKVLRGELSL